MKHAVRLFVSSVLIFAACVASAQSAPEVQQTPVSIEQLQREIDSLQRQLNALKSQSAATGTQASAPPPSLPIGTDASVARPAGAPEEGTVQTAHTEAPATHPAPDRRHSEPFAFADFTWLNGNPRTKDTPYATEFFTPEIRADVSYTYDFRHPADDTIGGSSEVFRAQEVVLDDLGIGGDFHLDNVHARVLSQIGLYSTATPRNDASPTRGQWDLADAYRYVSEANAGYHFNVQHGLNVDGGIFLSYVGLFSFYQFDNWAYQPSYVSSNTPWFFTGARVQYFPTEKLKIEPWFINGWQSYGRFNNRPGLGGQLLWRPNDKFQFIGNQYGYGEDALGVSSRTRYHTDDSIEYKYLDRPYGLLSKAALSLTGDAGCESGGGVSCHGNTVQGPKQSFLGFMEYNRFWFKHDQYGLTLGGGRINNPGRYLVLLPPINGATAASGTQYFTENPGDPFKAWDASVTADYMPSQYITWRLEYNHRAANVPYFAGPGGITPPNGNQGAPGSQVEGWSPDLRKSENRMTAAILVKF
ncbi:MAG TPA: outer membrane beta-barrel protein [Acidobacteriaceae bacterium]|nr:outer membrane beta-barrel protein [Acidobacteriaceae bacterium]